MHLELPVAAFTAAVVVLIPLPWHWRARNIPTLSIVAWLLVSNMIFGINAVIWADHVRNVAPVWCDIAAKIQIGANLGLPMCCLCLCIHLERIASVREARTTVDQKRRRMMFDLLMCWGLPMVYMATHYVVQGHRFDIFQYFGCRPATYVSIPAVFLVWVPPLTAAVLTFIYAGIALVHFFRRRLLFSRHLQNSNSGLTTSRYFRLMAMAIVQMFWAVTVTSFNMWFSCRNGLHPWTDWADVHYNFSRVARFPVILIPPYLLRWIFFLWWTVPITSFLFFAFFAFGQDAIREYKASFAWISRVVLRPQGSHPRKVSLPSPSLPRLRSENLSLPKFNKFSHSTGSLSYIQPTIDLSKALPPTPSFSPSSHRSSFMDTPTSSATYLPSHIDSPSQTLSETQSVAHSGAIPHEIDV